MKKIIFILVLLISFIGVSQEKKHGKKHMMNMSPEQMATLHTKKMTLALDLTDAQHNKVYKVNLENAKKRKIKMAEHKAMRESGEKEKLTSELLYARKNERLNSMIAHKGMMKDILSKEQYEKWEKMKRRGAHHKKGKSQGRTGKRRGGHHNKEQIKK